ncbi:MAG: helix-turn-helix domain-containing protein, partial [Bacteroidota bacterium]
FSIINANTPHKVITPTGQTRVMMLECDTDFLQGFLSQFKIALPHEIYVERTIKNGIGLLNNIAALYDQEVVPITTNPRVQECLNYLNSSYATYNQMMSVLPTKTNLSESRLSHIFKKEIGISIKKYLVWSRLKKAFHLVTQDHINMYEAAIQSGFYDQAHLSKAFKQMLGMAPSKVYNSRMLQD